MFRRLLSSLFVIVGLAVQAQSIQAQSVSVPFPSGFIGTIGQNPGKANAILNFATLGITQATFSQSSTDGQFGGIQGNDLSGTLTLRLSNGTTRTIAGAINWRITTNGTLQYFGFIPDPNNAAQTIPYGGGTYTLDAISNYGLRKVGSSLAFADGANVSGNAALSGLLGELNAYLATVVASGPKITGPSGAAGAAGSVKTLDEGIGAVHTFTADRAVTWTILGGADAARFSINATTGALAFLAVPDFEVPTDANTDNVYLVTLVATDSSGYTGQQAVTVTIADLDELAPRITGPSGGIGAVASVKSIPENQTVVHGFTADEMVMWSITGGDDAGRFTLNANTGALGFLFSPDFEAPNDTGTNNVYDIIVTATDTAGNNSAQSVAVTVTDRDELAATITGPSGAAGDAASAKSVPENQIAVHPFAASEAVTWSIAGGGDAARFAIDVAGVLTFAAAPNFEVPTDLGTDNVYDVVVRATDTDGNITLQTVAVTVTDLDDTAPAITGPSGAAGAAASATSVDEGTTAVHVFAASETVTWSITGGTDATLFTIDPATGALRFVTAPDFDAPADSGTDNVYNIVVTATDAASNTSQQTVAVTVTDLDQAAPVITGPSGAAGAAVSAKSVDEGTTAVHVFTASESGTWSIVGGADAGLFAIDPAAGALTFVVGPDLEAPADMGTNNVYDLIIAATDAAANTSQQAVAVTVRAVNEGDLTPPLITGPSGAAGAADSATSVAESQTAVATLTANEPVTWSISGGTDSGRFSIDPATGALTFGTAPDFEIPADADANNIYLVTVEAMDANGNTSQQIVTASVMDVAEDVTAPLITGPSGAAGALTAAKSVNEGTTAVHAFGANEAVIWTIGGGADTARFAIDPATGALSFRIAPDYEAPTDSGADNVYNIVVAATDPASNAAQQTVVVTVRDTVEGDVVPPVITGPSGSAGALTSAGSVSEGMTAVATFTADEAVIWTIVGGADAARFAVDPATGALTFVTLPDFEVPNDTGADNAYTLVIRATDGTGNTSQQTVTVTVADVAEDMAAPVVTGPSGPGNQQTETVAEGGTAVTTFTADEAVVWSVNGGADAGEFVIDPATGALGFLVPPDFATPTDTNGDNVYLVRVSATDTAGNVTEIMLAVTVTDAGAPKIAGPSGGPGAASSGQTVDEGSTVVATFAADEVVTWAIAGGPDAARFSLDPATGALRFVISEDYEAPTDTGTDNIYDLVVAATDAAGNVSEQTVRVTVANIPEDRTPPEVTGPSGTGQAQAETVAEGTTVVYTFAADEAVTWSLGGTDGAWFIINPATGALRFVEPPRFDAPIDAGVNNVYNLSLLATDAEGNVTELQLTVTVTDTQGPQITGLSGQPGATASTIQVNEGGTVLGTFMADEAVTWSIGGGTDAAGFVIDPATGALSFVVSPNYEAPADSDGDNVYDVVVTATDQNGIVSAQTVTVTVADMSDTPAELFEQRSDDVEAIITRVELNYLRASVASAQGMVRDARDRFVAGQELRDLCRDFKDDPVTSTHQDNDACSVLNSRNDVPFDVDGTLQIGSAGLNGAGSFFGQSGNFEGTRRRIILGDFQFVDDGEGIQTFALSGRMAWEQLLFDDVLLGFFLGGGYGESSVAQGLTGTIAKSSFALGSYVVAEPVDNLYLDGFVSLGFGRNDLALRDAEIDLAGAYVTRSFLIGGALSGVIRRPGFTIKPELSVAYGRTDIGDLNLAVTAFGTTEDVLARIDGVDHTTVRLTPEVLIPLSGLSQDTLLVVAPSLVCEWADGVQDCGGGLRLGLHGSSADGLTTFEIDFDADLVGDRSRMSVGASIVLRF